MDGAIRKLVEGITNSLRSANVKIVKGRLNKTDETIYSATYNALVGILCPNMKVDQVEVRELVIAHYNQLTKVGTGKMATDVELFEYLKSTYFAFDNGGQYEVYEKIHNKKGFTVREIGTWSGKGDVVNNLILRLGDKLDTLKEAIRASIEEDDGNKNQSVAQWLTLSLEAILSSKENQLDERPVGFTSDAVEPTKFFIDTSFIAKGAHPAFDEFTSKLEIVPGADSAKFFMAYIWSLYEPKDKNRVFLYLYGGGNDGKSAVINTVLQPLEQLRKTVDFSAADSHSSETWYDKRVLLNNENKKVKLAEMGLVKTVTGGDSILVNPKGKKGFDAKVNAKIIIVSNEQPYVSPREAEMSRLLPMQVLKRTGVTLSDTYLDRLAAELPAFLYSCREAYLELKSSRAKTHGAGFLSVESFLRDSGKYKDYCGLFIDDVFSEVWGFEFESEPSKYATKLDVIAKVNLMLSSPQYVFYKGKVDPLSDMFWYAFSRWAKSKNYDLEGSGDPRKCKFIGLRLVRLADSAKTVENSSSIVDSL